MKYDDFKIFKFSTILKSIDRVGYGFSRVYKNIKHQSGLIPIYFSLGLLHEENGDLQNAKKYFNQVLTLNSFHMQAKKRLKSLQ